jgi:hypothetical protein
MNHHRQNPGAVRAAMLLSILLIVVAPDVPAQQNSLSLDGPRLTPTATPTPSPTPSPPSAFARPQRAPVKPISRAAKIAIAATLLAVALVAAGFSMRAWRSFNLFDRQYRFPPIADANLRLGATKSGGCMATIVFNGDPSEGATGSAAKDF